MAENPMVLIVDDEPDILEFIKYNLQKEGFQVITAENGQIGIEKARSNKPNIIILDVMMPQLDGVEVCRILRSEKEFDNTAIAFLTARDEDYTQIAALDVGGDDFITKPIKPRVLVSRINALLRRTKKSEEIGSNEILKVGDIIIDKERVTVQRGEEIIELPRKEFELLTLLASRPGKVFTRNEIFDKIWGMDVIVGNRTIDVHIRKLREKVGENYIKTIKGVGYKFEF